MKYNGKTRHFFITAIETGKPITLISNGSIDCRAIVDDIAKHNMSNVVNITDIVTAVLSSVDNVSVADELVEAIKASFSKQMFDIFVIEDIECEPEPIRTIIKNIIYSLALKTDVFDHDYYGVVFVECSPHNRTKTWMEDYIHRYGVVITLEE